MGFSVECSLEEEISENGLVRIENNLISGLFSGIRACGGLDISENSTGVTLFLDGKRYSYSFGLDGDRDSVFSEVALKEELKLKLFKLMKDYSFDFVVLEDVFQGCNPKTTRILYALNTAFIELVYNGCIECNSLIRVQNGLWKSWLYSVDTENLYKGYNDKARVEACLGLLGIHESGVGFQDKLDSTGMIIGYLIKGRYEDEKVKGLSIKDLCFVHSSDYAAIANEARNERCTDDIEVVIVDIGSKGLTNKLFLDILSVRDNCSKIFVSSKPVVLGNFGKRIGLENTADGYIGWWLNKKALNRLNLLDKEG